MTILQQHIDILETEFNNETDVIKQANIMMQLLKAENNLYIHLNK